MRSLSKWLFAALLAMLCAALLALAMALEGAPQVAARDDVSPADVDRAVALARLHDPRLALPGQLRALTLRERDIDLLAQHAARRWLGANASVQLQAGRLRVRASVPAPLGRWLNVELVLRQSAALPEVERVRVGGLRLPAALALPMMRAFAARSGAPVDAVVAVDWVEHVTISPGQMMVSYRVGSGIANRLRAALVPAADQQRLHAYSERLVALAQDVAGSEVSLARLLPPLIALAAARSAAGGDAVAENRAALLVLTFFANRRPLALMVPAAEAWRQPRPLNVTLQERYDFPLHFLISAAVAAEAGTALADAVGLWKELDDARRGGSGFSFNDLAADRAGTRLGDLAVRDPARLYARFAGGAAEADFMPDARDLPEFLPEAEFLARYGGVGAPAYNRMLADIEARVDALPVFR